jgi:hypothetical protein
MPGQTPATAAEDPFPPVLSPEVAAHTLSPNPTSPNPVSLTHDIADSAPPGAAPARPIHDVELPDFEPATTGAQSGLILEKRDPAQRSVWTTENPALRAPCCSQSESGYVPRRPGKDQFQPADPAGRESGHQAADGPPAAANPESGPWPEPIGHAEVLLVP